MNNPAPHRFPWHKLFWLVVGIAIGCAITAAYFQPGLIFEQANLRYCG